MGISRQIGWTEKEKLLYEIYNKLKRANGLAYKWTQGDFFQQGAKLNPLPPPAPENAIVTVDGKYVQSVSGDYVVKSNSVYPDGAVTTLGGVYIQTLNNEFITI